MSIVYCLLALFGVTEHVLPQPLETPPFEYTLNSSCGDSESFPSLELINCIENDVVDYDQCFNHSYRIYEQACSSCVERVYLNVGVYIGGGSVVVDCFDSVLHMCFLEYCSPD